MESNFRTGILIAFAAFALGVLAGHFLW